MSHSAKNGCRSDTVEDSKRLITLLYYGKNAYIQHFREDTSLKLSSPKYYLFFSLNILDIRNVKGIWACTRRYVGSDIKTI